MKPQLEKNCGIYKIENTINKKCYIGQSIDMKKREKTHFYYLHKGTHQNRHLQNSVNKYGIENFTVTVLESSVSPEDLTSREQHHMDTYQAYNHDYGFNLCPTAGSPLGTKRTKDELSKMSKAHSGENCYKAKLTEQQVAEIRDLIELVEMPVKNIAERYNVSTGAIYHIKEGNSWANKYDDLAEMKRFVSNFDELHKIT